LFTNFDVMKKKSKIIFFYKAVSFYFRDRNRLKSFIIEIAESEGFKIEEIRIIFCDKRTLREINRKFLNHNYDTDIITFRLSNIKHPLEAELYISIPRLKEQAKEWGSSFKQELHRIIFHGLLHLCGYNDKTAEQKTEIRAKEDYLLKTFFS